MSQKVGHFRNYNVHFILVTKIKFGYVLVTRDIEVFFLFYNLKYAELILDSNAMMTVTLDY